MKYHGQFNPPVDQILEEYYFQNKYNLTSIECGATDGNLENCTKYFEDNYNWKTINIEPVPYLFDLLSHNRPRSVNMCVALSEKNGVRKFSHAVHPLMGMLFGNGSLHHVKSHREQLLREGCTFQEFDVECISYISLIDRLELKSLDLFVLDVEGHEIEVLNGMKGASIWPQVFVIEFPHIGLNTIKSILHELNPKYVLDFYKFNNAFFSLQSDEPELNTS